MELLVWSLVEHRFQWVGYWSGNSILYWLPCFNVQIRLLYSVMWHGAIIVSRLFFQLHNTWRWLASSLVCPTHDLPGPTYYSLVSPLVARIKENQSRETQLLGVLTHWSVCAPKSAIHETMAFIAANIDRQNNQISANTAVRSSMSVNKTKQVSIARQNTTWQVNDSRYVVHCCVHNLTLQRWGVNKLGVSQHSHGHDKPGEQPGMNRPSCSHIAETICFALHVLQKLDANSQVWFLARLALAKHCPLASVR